MEINGLAANKNSSTNLQANKQDIDRDDKKEPENEAKVQTQGTFDTVLPGKRIRQSTQKQEEAQTQDTSSAWGSTSNKTKNQNTSAAEEVIKNFNPESLNKLNANEFNSKMYELLEKGAKESIFFKKALDSAKKKEIIFKNINNDPKLNKVVPKDVYGFHDSSNKMIALSPTAIDNASRDNRTKDNEYNRYYDQPFSQNFLSTVVNEASHLITDNESPKNPDRDMLQDTFKAVQSRDKQLSELENIFTDMIINETISFLSSEMAEKHKPGDDLASSFQTESIPGDQIKEKELGKLLEYSEGYVLNRFFDFNNPQQLQFANRVAGRIITNYESPEFHNKFQTKLLETGLVKSKAKSTYKFNPAFWNRGKQ